jgi:hypothetical protein
VQRQLVIAERADSAAFAGGGAGARLVLRSLEDLAGLLHAAVSQLGSRSAAARVAGAHARATGLEEGLAGRLPEARAQGSSLAGGPAAFF